MNTNVKAVTKANNRAHTIALKDEGIKSSRANALRVSIAALHVDLEQNPRKLNPDHVQQLKTAFANGQKPSAFLVYAVEVDGKPRFSVLGGYHTYHAIAELIAEGQVFTNDSVFDIEPVTVANKTDAMIAAFNHNSGMKMSVLDNARFFQSCLDEGMTLDDLVARTGVSKPVICNTKKLLEGDSELIKMVEDDLISPSKARKLINEHGADNATKFAKIDVTLRTQKQQPETELAAKAHVSESSNNVTAETVTVGDTGESGEVRVGKRGGLRYKNLTNVQRNEMESLIKTLARRIGEGDSIQLTGALSDKLTKLAKKVEEIDAHNQQVRDAIEASAAE